MVRPGRAVGQLRGLGQDLPNAFGVTGVEGVAQLRQQVDGALEPGPARKAVLARQCQLRIAQDRAAAAVAMPRDARQGLGVAGDTGGQQLLGLGAVLIEIGAEKQGRHGDLPFAQRGSFAGSRGARPERPRRSGHGRFAWRRRSAPDPAAAVAEAARVLRPGGTVRWVDSVAPDDPAADTFLNCIELLRDPSHVRGMQTPEPARLMLRRLFDGAPAAIREAFRVQTSPYAFAIPIALPRAGAA